MEILTAYHEAAHAVMCHMAGLEILELSIIPNEAKSRLGHCKHSFYDDFHPEYFSDAETPEKTNNLLLLLVAGAVAEEILTGSWDIGADSDLQHAIYLAVNMASSGHEIEKIINASWQEANKIITQNWRTVEELAFRLIETKQLRAEQIKSIIETNMGDQNCH